jgi:hypothetical protein
MPRSKPALNRCGTALVSTTARTFSSAAARPNAAMSCSSKEKLKAFTGERARLISAIRSETS